eukprot:TRINITY_DN16629_c0_g1_i1.p1 TRINITY_DN16629_c0_g1~~TRINITY_DN16629_c0_g1_i1.p1  ORF type:complete len:499 (+),score=64.01 TRINITY_DN16629_c0_g1_i1:194-1690(+)
MVAGKSQRLYGAIEQFKLSGSLGGLLQELHLILGKDSCLSEGTEHCDKSESTQLHSIRVLNENGDVKEHKKYSFNSPSELIEEIAPSYFSIESKNKLVPSNKLHAAESDFKVLLSESKSFLSSHSKTSSPNLPSSTHRLLKSEIKKSKEAHSKSFNKIDSPTMLRQVNTTPGCKHLKSEDLFARVERSEPSNKAQESPRFSQAFEAEPNAASQLIEFDTLFSKEDTKHSRTAKADLLPSERTENILKEYLKRDSRKKKSSLILQISCASCLRYIKLKELLYTLEKVSGNGLVSKKDFAGVVQVLARTKGLDTRSCIQEEAINKVYDAVNGGDAKALSIKELAGALSPLCSGTINEKIKTALKCIGSKEGKTTFSTAFQFLQSLYKLLLQKSLSLVKNGGITPTEVSRITARQCFADHKTDTSMAISTDNFIQWFLSHVKTLVPQHEVAKSHPKKILKNKAESYSICSATGVYSRKNLLTDSKTPANKKEMQRGQNSWW